jgi:hypothetical protein
VVRDLIACEHGRHEVAQLALGKAQDGIVFRLASSSVKMAAPSQSRIEATHFSVRSP